MSRWCDVKALKKLMIDKDIQTITELSEKTGVNRNTLSDVMNEKAQPSADVMMKLCDALEMEPAMAGNIFFAEKLTEYVS